MLSRLIPAQHVCSLAAVRLGAHHFEVAAGHCARNPRFQCVFQLCATHAMGHGIGGEFHVVFERSGYLGNCMPRCLKRSGGGRPWCHTTPARILGDSSCLYTRVGWPRSLMHASVGRLMTHQMRWFLAILLPAQMTRMCIHHCIGGNVDKVPALLDFVRVRWICFSSCMKGGGIDTAEAYMEPMV